MSIYGATKSFNDTFSRMINREERKVDVLSHRPGLTKTSMTFNAGFITPQEVAYQGLRSLGIYDLTFGTWKHQIFSMAVFQ